MKRVHRYSQKFLSNRAFLKKIMQNMDIDAAVVVEIGAGDGRLSEHLFKTAGHVYCIEIDSRFYEQLKKRFEPYENVTVVNADILSWPLAALGQSVVIVGNIPYHISKQLTRYLIVNRAFIQRAYCTFQREFADKLLAKASGPGYCAFSCFFQYYANARRLFDIPASAFSPAPRVASTFMRIDFFDSTRHKALSDDFLFELVEAAFSQRRKKIINSLASYTEIAAVLTELDIAPDLRAENISLTEYVRLANALYP